MSSENRDDPDNAPLRPIPDGGLKRAMPEWLKRPPTWSESAPTSRDRVMPEPETSPIDPRTLVAVDDLPQWLQDLARRERRDRSTPAEVATQPHVPEEEPTMPDEKITRTALETEPTPSREVKFESQNPSVSNVEDGKVETYGGGKPGFQPSMLLMMAALVIAALLIFALLTYL